MTHPNEEVITAERGERTIAWRHVNVYHVRDGKIAEVWSHPGDQYAVDGFWSSSLKFP